MLGKLVKYEFKYMARIFLPLYIALIVAAGISRAIFRFSNEHEIISAASAVSIFALIALFVAVAALPAVFTVIRFFKSIAGDEGYLTFTLPVKASEIILSKLISAVIFGIFSTIAIGCALMILLVDVAWIERIVEVIGEFIAISPIDFTVIVIEVIISLILSMIFMFCQLYAAMSIGQTSGKHKILCSVAAYFGIYMVIQMISTLGTVILDELGVFNLAFTTISSGIAVLCLYSVYYFAVSALLFLLSSHLLTKKLNLE